MRLLGIAAVLLSSAAAGPKLQFDLKCTGTIKNELLDPGQPTNFTLHVDLAAKKWCQEGSCSTLQDIAEVQPAMIYFEKESPEDQLLHNRRSRFVNRETGGYILDHDVLVDAGTASFRSFEFVDGQCEPAPFSGFPKVETKF